MDQEKVTKSDHLRFPLETTADIRNDLARKLVTKGLNLYELRSDAYSLEEIFLHLTTKEEVA